MEQMEFTTRVAEALISDLESDKDRLMHNLKREAPHLFRKYETNVFIDLVARRKKV
jgi:hypothetical protein